MTIQKLKKINEKSPSFFAKRKLIRHTLFGLVVLSQFSIFMSSSFPAKADTLSNNNYSIDVGTIDTNPQPTVKTQPQVLGEQSPKPEFTTGPDYTVNTSNDSFSVQLSQKLIDYGILTSTNPVIRNSTISVSDPSLGAEVLTYENHPLLSAKNDVIQNTTCDNGACDPITAALWNNTLTFGFGYRCDSADESACDSQFSTSNYFKQYPEDSLNQQSEPVLTNSAHSPKTTATITYKVNISGTQKTAAYYNNITYIAVPNF